MTAQTAPTLGVQCIDPAEDAAWLALLKHKHAGLFHSPPWLRALTDAYGFRIRAYVAMDGDGAIRGGVPFCELDDCVGRRLAVLPFSDCCDPLASSPDVWRLLLAQLQSHGLPVNMRCMADRVVTNSSLQVTKRARWHTLSVAPSQEALWDGLASPVRRAIQKAKRAGVEVRPLCADEGREGFHKLHVALRKSKYRLLAQPSIFFEAIAQRFGASGDWLPLGAFLDGRLIAATIYLRWRDTLYYKFNASAPDALSVRPNNLLLWEGVSLARSLGCHTLDLGPSDDDQPGLIRFKRNFGAAEHELRFLRWTPPGWQDERGVEIRRLLGEVTTLLTDLGIPDEVTARAGAALYRFFA